MPFTYKPGSEPCIGVTREDAVRLLLTSIAEEEASLSKLMDAERNNILYTVNRYRQRKTDLREIYTLNKSVDTAIKNMMKYQMLLQIKLDSVKEMLASSAAASATASAATACSRAKPTPPREASRTM